MSGRRRRTRFTQVALAAAAALVAASCSTSSGAPPGSGTTSSAGAKVAGGTVTYALPVNVTINYIWPFMSITVASTYNANQFQWLLYRPLYVFGGNDNTVAANYALSPANAPVYSSDGKSVTITMKGWKWSNGESVDAKDVVFWMNLMAAEKANFYGYVPGTLPDNTPSWSATGPDQVTINMDKAYSSYWFTYNQLATITPMPMAWDVTSAGAAAGSGGCTTDSAADKWAKCKAVYTFLSAQAKDASHYASSPIWGVVDGPWKLSSFSTDGNVTIVPNTSYSGTPKPVLSAFKYVPFTSDAATFTALKTGNVDIATIPQSDLPQKPAGSAVPAVNPLGGGYNLVPWYPFGISYIQVNFNGPTRALMRQLYVRQALQELVDQPAMVNAIWHGYAVPDPGPVPPVPASQWKGTVEDVNGGQGAYPFSIATAKSLLTSHGWQDTNGVMTCQNPSQCGAGIAAGTPLKFTIDYSNGTTEFANEMAVYKSDASQIGVQINIVGQSFNTVIGESTPCTPGPKCPWDALMYGGWVFNGPGYEPTGEPLFSTGSGSNSGSYSNPTEDSLINQTHTNSDLNVFYQYAQFTMQQAPYIWMPNFGYVNGVVSTLHNVNAFSPVYSLFPEFWYFTK